MSQGLDHAIPPPGIIIWSCCWTWDSKSTSPSASGYQIADQLVNRYPMNPSLPAQCLMVSRLEDSIQDPGPKLQPSQAPRADPGEKIPVLSVSKLQARPASKVPTKQVRDPQSDYPGT
ncbi:hypothetical protein DSO57_1034642 [Entomophthora muscae]|uniref:Uncharacterized protein n=1 Tax=Entomophthora muscae TaxID=34485 RepID=A0ACC2RQR4_9FUNG|nr:hypothetical protein DSO57_1034642 [Entomophthora muscae]